MSTPDQQSVRHADSIFRGASFKAAPLLFDHVDTDQIIPSREMRQVSRHGLADGLFAGWRYTAPGSRDKDKNFILNQPEYDAVQGLVVGVNFGCGSSREHAVWALREFGIRIIIAKSFGHIFHSNCAKNGILALTLPEADVELLAAHGGHGLSVDLEAGRLDSSVLTDGAAEFSVDPYDRRLLLEGLDPIGLTLTGKEAIDRFFEKDRSLRPWVHAIPE